MQISKNVNNDVSKDPYSYQLRCQGPLSSLYSFVFLALVRDDIRPAQITNKPRFDNANFQSYDELISKAAKMKKKKITT